jgi:D-glutamate cyclase
MAMAARRDPRPLVDCIEALIQQDVGRNLGPLFAAARGGLWGAASALARGRPGPIGLITGFYVPQGAPPAAETDGPVGAALLARGFTEIGLTCRLATDEPCRRACAVALAAAGAAAVPVDSVEIGAPLAGLVATWRRSGVASAISIERCGKSADGRPRNMRGEDISDHTAPLDELFAAGPWRTVAIGDGGNEIGMGKIPWNVVRSNIRGGALVACRLATEYLIVCGVSNWGAYGLATGVRLLRAEPHDADLYDLERERDLLRIMVEGGPLVDGVSGKPSVTVDGLSFDTYATPLRRMGELAAAIG